MATLRLYSDSTELTRVQISSMAPNFTKFKWNNGMDVTSEPYRVRALMALEYINWDALKLEASRVRSVPCHLGNQYGFGGRNVVREIVFDDNVHWIARVKIPGVNFDASESYIPKPVKDSWSATCATEMQSEIDTMSFVRESADIPTPHIFAYDVTATNSVGAPFMLMECYDGTCAMDMPDSFQDIIAQFRHKYYRAEAEILVHNYNRLCSNVRLSCGLSNSVKLVPSTRTQTPASMTSDPFLMGLEDLIRRLQNFIELGLKTCPIQTLRQTFCLVLTQPPRCFRRTMKVHFD